MAQTVDEALVEVAAANRVMGETGLAPGVLASLGHASMRRPDQTDRFLIKGRGQAIDALARVQPDDVIECDLEGFKTAGLPHLMQVSEVKIHSCIYRARPDVQAVVHAHPRFTVLMSVLAERLVPLCKEGYELVAEPIPVYRHMKIVNSDEEGTELAETLGGGATVLLTGHGAVTVADSLEVAVIAMLNLEEQARMNWHALAAMGPDHPRIPEALIEESENAAPFWTLPHFRDTHPNGKPRRDGLWKHLKAVVSDEQ